ncbi:hypothetical protein LTR62_007147 [Meristemomyces frigidus]|uniref:SigF-like NTF2-like domain-containing protein n=1 Tax=Meristemomyces frigidus TaxID=1508187 RepID=A0AAN7TAY1_9PEZI|nr:hypothetical protein LTR62_007147 [Meristemomyces frigidus]
MDDPPAEITSIVESLTMGTPNEQEQAINKYFTQSASFTHPFCRTGSFANSRLLIHAIFRWYKVMSPVVRAKVLGVAYDESNMVLYVDIEQVFAIWFLPFHRAPVRLTTKLSLTKRKERGSLEERKYYIRSQEDLYPVDQFVKFFAPWNVGTAVVYAWHFVATFFCVLLSLACGWFTKLEQRYAEGKTGGVEKLFMQTIVDVGKSRMGSLTPGTTSMIDGRKAAAQVHEAARNVQQKLLTDGEEEKGSKDGNGTERFGNMQVISGADVKEDIFNAHADVTHRHDAEQTDVNGGQGQDGLSNAPKQFGNMQVVT